MSDLQVNFEISHCDLIVGINAGKKINYTKWSGFVESLQKQIGTSCKINSFAGTVRDGEQEKYILR